MSQAVRRSQATPSAGIDAAPLAHGAVPTAAPRAVHDDTRPVPSPVHGLHERLQIEMARREQAGFDSFSAKQTPILSPRYPLGHQARAAMLILAGGVGGWAVFFSGALFGLY